jgi:glycosyltransferase involved in cell wall biosynthesis
MEKQEKVPASNQSKSLVSKCTRPKLRLSRFKTRKEPVSNDSGHVSGILPLKNARNTNVKNNTISDSCFFDVGRLPILVHCHLRWDFVWQRPQQIFSRLAAHHPILFTEEPMWEDGEPHVEVNETYANIFRLIPVLPPKYSTSVDAQCEAVLPMLRSALSKCPGRFESPIQWFYSPLTAPSFLGQFGAATVVYDCMDELANFRFAAPDMSHREQFLLSRADVVFTGGHHLFESKSRHHPNVHFFGCGVDVDHYSKAAVAETAVPAAVANLPGPIFGYFGVIDERLDYDLLTHLAKRRPEASIVMIGPLAKIERHVLPSLPNIHWLGQQAYADLPAFLKAFDVCLMPFALNEATQYINPTKTLEYMASGKPIVSTAIPDVVRNFTPIVDVARSHEEFVLAVDRAHRCPNADFIAQGMERVNAASWETTVSAMRGYVLRSVRPLLSWPPKDGATFPVTPARSER